LITFDTNKKKLEDAKEKIVDNMQLKSKDLEINKASYNKMVYEMAELKKKLELYESGTCPTCESPLTTDFHQHRKDQISTKVSTMPERISESKVIVDAIGVSIAELRSKETQVLDKVSSLNVNIRNLKNELLQIKEGMEGTEQFDHMKQIIEDFQAKEQATGSQKDNYAGDYAFLEIVEDVLGEDGVKNLAVKTILPGLNANISAMSQTMHIPFQIKFNDKFDCVITHLGQEINAMTLSTGERKKADFIIIIAIIKILKLRFPQLNLLFLDELLSSVDQDGIYNILKILSQVIKESKINTFVINHSTLPHEIFDKKLQIYRDNGFSKFEVEAID